MACPACPAMLSQNLAQGGGISYKTFDAPPRASLQWGMLHFAALPLHGLTSSGLFHQPRAQGKEQSEHFPPGTQTWMDGCAPETLE